MSKPDEIIGKLDPTKTQCWLCKRYVDLSKLSKRHSDYMDGEVLLCNLCTMATETHQKNKCENDHVKCELNADCFKCFKATTKNENFCEEVKTWILYFQKAIYG